MSHCAKNQDAASSPLRTPLFRALVVGWSAANFADSLLTIILAVWVYDLTGSTALGGLTFAMIGIPALAAPFLGYVIDRVSRRQALVVAYATGALWLLPLLLVDSAQDVWVVYVVSVIYAGVSYITGACQSGLLKDTVPEAHLGKANGILTTIDQALRMALPLIGAGVYSLVGMTPLVLISALSFLVAAIIFVCLRIQESPADAMGPERGAMLAGFRFLFSQKPLAFLAWGQFASMAALGIVNGVVFALFHNLGISPEWMGPLVVFQGVGGVVAGMIVPRMMDKYGRVRVFAVSLIALGVALVPMMLQSIALLAVTQIIVGAAVIGSIVAYVTERQVAAPDRMQGRVAAASQVALNIPSVIVTAISAALTAWIDYRFHVAVMIAVILLSGLYVLRQGQRTVNSLG